MPPLNLNGTSGASLIEAAAAPFPVGQIVFFARRTAPDGFLEAAGQNVSRTTFAALFAEVCPVIGNPTISIASPGVFTLNNHGLLNGDRVRLSTTGALPTGLNATTDYFVVSAATNTFSLSATEGGAAINTSGTQSGVHTVRAFPFGSGDGSTTFGLPDLRGEFVRGLDRGRGVDSNRRLGASQADAMQGHRHSPMTGSTFWGNGGAIGSGQVVGSSSAVTGETTGNAVTDTVNGAPRTAAETRPRNVALLACIKT